VTELSLVGSIASLILAIIAIWLSVKFFQLSENSARHLDSTAKSIELVINRVEPLLERLYSDTFSLVRDTMGDLRAHAWPIEHVEREAVLREVEQRAEAKVQEVREEVVRRIGELSVRVGVEERTELRQEMARVVETAIERSRGVESEARSEALFAELIRAHDMLADKGNPVTAAELIRALVPPFQFGDVADEFVELRRRGTLLWSGDLTPSSLVTLVRDENGSQ